MRGLGNAALLAMMWPAAVGAQSPDQATLRQELDQARAELKALQSRIDTIEADLAKPPTSTPAMQSASAPMQSGADMGAVQSSVASSASKSDRASVTVQDRALDLATPAPLTSGFSVAPKGLSSAAEFTGGSGEGRATFSLARRWIEPTEDARINQWRLTLSAPLAKGGDDTSFATLDGLASGTKLELSWNTFRMPLPYDTPKGERMMQEAEQRCLQAVPAWPDCRKHDTRFIDAFVGTIDGENAARRAEYDDDYAKATLQKASSFGFHAGIGFDKFAFYDATTLDKNKTSKWSFSAGGALTVFPIARSSLTLDGSYEHAFEASDSKTACPPATGAVVKCVSGALAPPDGSSKLIASLQFNTFLPISKTGLLKKVGLAPKFEYDALSDDIAFDLPVYFVPDDKGNLTGGVHIGYTTKDKTIVGVFFGSSFGISRK
jgi:hypothetical protein